METTIDGRRYWKEGDQWYVRLEDRQSMQRIEEYQTRLPGETEWTTRTRMNAGVYFEFPLPESEIRVKCDDPTAANVVKEGDTVQTPMGPGKAMKPVSGTFTTVIKPGPIQAVVTDVNGDVANDIVRSLRGPTIVLDRLSGQLPLEFFVDDFEFVENFAKYHNCSTVHLRGRGENLVAVECAEVLKRVQEARKALDDSQAERAKSRGAFAVALEDSQPDGDYHKAKALGVPVGVVCFPDFVFFYDQLESARQDASNPEFSIVTLKGGLTKKVKATCDEIARAIGEAAQAAATRTKTHADQVAKTSTITLRDQFALAALPAVIEKFGLSNAKDLATEVWYIADVMMVSGGKAKEARGE